MSRKLVIAPHLDDEIIGCGGILDENTHVYFCGLQKFHVVPGKKRIIELKNVATWFGFSWQINYTTEVNRYVGNEFIDIFQNLIDEVKPEKIYIPYPSYNQDHQEIYHASMIALRPHDKIFFVKKVLVYEGIGAFQWYKPDYEVNHWTEINIIKKLVGYSYYTSQVRGHRSPDHIKALAKLRGSQIGVPYAEAYIIKRWVE